MAASTEYYPKQRLLRLDLKQQHDMMRKRKRCSKIKTIISSSAPHGSPSHSKDILIKKRSVVVQRLDSLQTLVAYVERQVTDCAGVIVIVITSSSSCSSLVSCYGQLSKPRPQLVGEARGVPSQTS
jgi:hypothetical protein